MPIKGGVRELPSYNFLEIPPLPYIFSLFLGWRWGKLKQFLTFPLPFQHFLDSLKCFVPFDFHLHYLGIFC